MVIIKSFKELDADELYEILRLRVSVFVVEQNCPYEELDGKDKQSYHIYIKDEDGIQAYLRIFKSDSSSEEAVIGRVIAVKRRNGMGSKLLELAIDFAKRELKAKKIRIEAQTYIKAFYAQHGFKQDSEEYFEDGIPHITMIMYI